MKKRSNEEALKIYPKLEDILADSEDRLLDAVKLAIAGSIIDFGPSHEN